jgi:hypothetical protein
MKVDVEDVLFWMDAIRNSDDRYRTLESFWKGQVRSKVWIAEQLPAFVPVNPLTIIIYGGWNGVLSSILFNSKLNIEHITSIDIDPTCEEIARTVNKRQEMLDKFEAVTHDMCKYIAGADVVINTSCEHITQEQYNEWLDNQPDDAVIVLQSNNYFELEEHIRCSIDLNDFTKMSNIEPFYRGSMDTPKYERYMLIGRKKRV